MATDNPFAAREAEKKRRGPLPTSTPETKPQPVKVAAATKKPAIPKPTKTTTSVLNIENRGEVAYSGLVVPAAEIKKTTRTFLFTESLDAKVEAAWKNSGFRSRNAFISAVLDEFFTRNPI